MKSINFPNMFQSNSTQILVDYDATKSNAHLLLASEKGEFFGDPYFGIRLKRYIFNQNDAILKDIIIDEIYTQLVTFMPQLIINRNDINILQPERGVLVANFKATNKSDFTVDNYSLVLFNSEEE